MSTLKNAWISPAGEILRCCMYGHCEAAAEFLRSRGVVFQCAETHFERHGWLKLSNGAFYFLFFRALTEKQLDFVYNYSTQIIFNCVEYEKDNINELRSFL